MKQTASDSRRASSRRKPASCRSKPVFVPDVRSNGRFRGLHQALRDAIPALREGGRLNSMDMELSFQKAMQSTSVAEFKQHYLDANLMKRYIGSDLSDASARVSNAVEKLLESEVKCAYTNLVFSGGLDRSNARIPLEYVPTLFRAKRIVHEILGKFPWERFPGACDFTPGATTEFPRKEAALHNKWARAAHVTARALPYADAFLRWAGVTTPAWSETLDHPDLFPGSLPGGLRDRQYVIDDANVVFTVPKNFERDRTACKPVTWNGFLQKGVGTLIRKRLQRVKLLLLADAQEYHGVLAKLGSATGALCTRDLASASDCVSLGLVEALLPPDWLRVVLDLREEHGVLPDGRKISWEKLSTMGNGFTFELETLLFYALVASCNSSGSMVSVYGDDIIFPSNAVDKVDEILTFCGFTINTEKSFHKGGFRESCGSHYFDGIDVKPFYLMQLPQSLGDVINLHNDIVRWHGGKPPIESCWWPVLCRCREIVPREYWGPAPLQGVLWAEWDESCPVYVKDYQSFRVGMIVRETLPGEELCSHVGAYLQKLWKVDPLPWESSAPSYLSKVGDREVRSWAYLCRTQWNRVAVGLLCP
jgi:hypothetical protein